MILVVKHHTGLPSRNRALKHVAARNRLASKIATMPPGGYMSFRGPAHNPTGRVRIRRNHAGSHFSVKTLGGGFHKHAHTPKEAARYLYRAGGG